jgi:Cd2+/Zn2+-exporting ATPase
MVDRFARVYTPIVIVVALSMCTIPWLVDREMGRKWMMNGLIIIVIACPCALTISTPVTYAAGLTAAARRGIIVKGGCHLESLGNVKTVVLDKTGTITWGKFRLVELVITCDTFKRREALELLAVMESHSSHPLSATLVNAAHAEGVSIPKDLDVKDHTTIPGEGLTAVVDKKSIYLGNARLLERIGHYQDLPDKHKMLSVEWGKAGCTVGYLSVEGMGIVAMFCVSDILREEAADVVETLEVMGVRVMMVTGDGEGTARAVAEEVGIDMDHVHSQCSPEDKMYHIGRLQGSPLDFEIAHCYQKKLVAMVGDGVNDVGALKRADVVSMVHGKNIFHFFMSDLISRCDLFDFGFPCPS